jgi:hypothetical protein
MNVEFAHKREMSTLGREVNFAVFYAQANNDTDSSRHEWLSQLTFAARQAGRKVEAAALVYEQHGQIKWWGDPFVVDYINKAGVPSPTHTLSLK